MALGLSRRGGIASEPQLPNLGLDSWAEVSMMQPDSPYLGGGSGADPDGGVMNPMWSRQRISSLPGAATAAASGAPSSMSHWSDLFNVQHNSTFWILIAAILFLGLMHLRVAGSVGAGARVGR
jgi:hypothetical protein